MFIPKTLRTAKCGFLILLIVSASLFLLMLCIEKDEPVEQNEDFQYLKPELQFSQDMLDVNFDSCLFAPYFFLGNSSNHNESITNFTRYDYLQSTKEDQNKLFPLANLLIDFGNLMLSFMRVEIVLIEPSLLFCMLSPKHKALLLKRNFDVPPFDQKVVTLGIRGEDADILQRKNVLKTIKSFGFDIIFVKEPAIPWMNNESSSDNDSYCSHIFLKRGDWTIHLVVLYTRDTFFWHSALKISPFLNVPPIEKLFFAEAESAYDNFTFVSLGLYGEPLNFIYIPSNPQYFLFEMDSSKFIECNSTIVSSFLLSQGTKTPETHGSLSEEYFNHRAVVALQELKVLLTPLLMHFWIWSGTMLGWHRQCDIIPYTTDVDFGAWATEVDDLPALLKILENNKHIYLKQRMGMAEIALEFFLYCHSLRVDVFFLYEESNGTWYAGHRPSKGYYFKYHHPNFTLCSASLLGHKVLVPCETEDVITAEYGANWFNPVSSWNYERSIYNRGPNIYWDKSLLKTVYSD